MDHRIEVSHRVDIDHRKMNKLGPKDVDHRNLISLTGSPRKETKPLLPPPAFVWPEDQDYRCKISDTDFRVSQMSSDFSDMSNSNFSMCQTSQKVSSCESVERKDVNVESIDMDVSEEDDDESGGLIHLEEDIGDCTTDSLNSFVSIQSNSNNLKLTSSFVEGSSTTMLSSEDIDERLKPNINEGLSNVTVAKTIPLEENSSLCSENQALSFRKEESRAEVPGSSVLMQSVQSNGFDSDFCNRSEFFRRETTVWQQDCQLEQILPFPPNANVRGFGMRMGRSSPRPLRGRAQHRFIYRPHHPRPEVMRGRMPFRARLPQTVRGSRW